jgi:hypothetical protein
MVVQYGFTYVVTITVCILYVAIKINLKEVGWGSMDWIDLAQDRDR